MLCYGLRIEPTPAADREDIARDTGARQPASTLLLPSIAMLLIGLPVEEDQESESQYWIRVQEQALFDFVYALRCVR